jgi:formylglycine-generating enzyme required for sulfatase activity
VSKGGRWIGERGLSYKNPGYTQDDYHPVVCVNWNDAKAYAAWLSKRTSKRYKLLSEAEWEYVARAGTEELFWWGSSIDSTRANYNGDTLSTSDPKGEFRAMTVHARTFAQNPWGLYQVHGNVWEWTEDCWNKNYEGAPKDGTARTTGECSSRVVRGGSWYDHPRYLRASSRGRNDSDGRSYNFGFRVARALD